MVVRGAEDHSRMARSFRSPSSSSSASDIGILSRGRTGILSRGRRIVVVAGVVSDADKPAGERRHDSRPHRDLSRPLRIRAEALGEKIGRGLASSALAATLSLAFAGGAICGETRGGAVGFGGFRETAVGLFGPDIDRDPVEPFTLYGDVSKKFYIDNLDEKGKIVGRRRGFTATVCITAAGQSQESPNYANGLPLSENVDRFGAPTCIEVVGQDLEKTCDKACARGCEEQIRAYLTKLERDTGFKLEPGEPRRLLISCSKRCFKESQKPGADRPFALTWLR